MNEKDEQSVDKLLLPSNDDAVNEISSKKLHPSQVIRRIVLWESHVVLVGL